MFRFFRRMRSTAMMNHRFVRYFLYALGEIALVVIGILIALYVNERQEWREDRRQERAYLIELQQDLERNLEELERVIAKSQNVVIGSDSLIAYSRRAPKDIPDERMVQYVDHVMGYTKHMTQQGTIEDLMGSGRLEVIRNDTIRRAIATWEADLKLMRELEVDAKASFLNLVEYLNTNVPTYERPDLMYLKTELLAQMRYLNRLMDRAITTDYLNEVYRDMKPFWEELLAQVNREINQAPAKTASP